MTHHWVILLLGLTSVLRPSLSSADVDVHPLGSDCLSGFASVDWCGTSVGRIMKPLSLSSLKFTQCANRSGIHIPILVLL